MTNAFNPLILFALEDEAQGLFPKEHTFFTGVGKVNAAYYAAKLILSKKPTHVMNFGTAGSKVFNHGEVISCTQFIQRDMDCTPLAFPMYETPFSTVPQVLEYGEDVTSADKYNGICGSGDTFVTNLSGKEPYNLVEMEAYGIALICMRENVPFYCAKYISDGADGSSPETWENALKDSGRRLFICYTELCKSIGF